MRSHLLFATTLLASGCTGGDAIRVPVASETRESIEVGTPIDMTATASLDLAAVADDSQRQPPSLPDDDETCARDPLGELVGASVMQDGVADTWSATQANVRWVLFASAGCVDRYYPAGTVSFTFADRCKARVEPGTVPVQRGDGLLTIDRRSEVVRYAIRGATTWEATIRCDDDDDAAEPPFTVGGPWALARGALDGDLVVGYDERDGGADWWDFRRVGAEADYAAAIDVR